MSHKSPAAEEKRPLVSIVIPCHNYGHWVREAIESALAQTYPATEVIVVDDGSTDDSVEVARSFGQRIRLVEQANVGVSKARNRGFAESRGDYVMFLDADDVMKPGCVEQLATALQKAGGNTAIAYCDLEAFGTAHGIIRGHRWAKRKLLYRNYIMVSALIRRDAFEAVNGYRPFELASFSYEDWDLWLRIVEAGYVGVYTRGALVRYRWHGRGRHVQQWLHQSEFDSELRTWHAALYSQWDNRLYLLVFLPLSRLRNAIFGFPAPLTD